MTLKSEPCKKWRIWLLLFFSFSFIGWLWEVLFHFVTDGVFVNRGVLYGPWLPIYGSVGIMIVFVAGYLKEHPVGLFFAIMAFSAVAEYATSWALEQLTGKRWWDYSSYACNLKGRICLYGLVFFGVGGMVLVYWVVPWLEKSFRKIPSNTLTAVCILLSAAFAADALFALKTPNQGEGISNPAAVVIEQKQQAPR